MSKFIKELGCPSRVLITSKQQYLDFIKKHNGKTNLYETVYKYKYLRNDYTPEYNSAKVNLMFFDMDSNDALKTCIMFHNYLKQEDIRHFMKQSSYMRFHIYVRCGDTDVENKKDSLMNAMIDLAKKAGLTYGKGSKFDLDSSTFGDLARICPIAGTYKPKKKSWCNYITENDLFNRDRLKEKAESCGGRITYYGSKLINLKDYDFPCKQNIHRSFDVEDFTVKFNNKYVNILPPLAKKILADYKGYGNWQNRWRFAILCRDFGYPSSLVDDIANTYFSRVTNNGSMNGKGTNYDHFKKVKILKLVYEGYEKYKFPVIDKLVKEGYEIEKEDTEFFKQLYF